jgi:hypothetical protein
MLDRGDIERWALSSVRQERPRGWRENKSRRPKLSRVRPRTGGRPQEERAKLAEERLEAALRAAEELASQVSAVDRRVQAIEARGLELRRHAEARIAAAEDRARAAERHAANRAGAAEACARLAEERLGRVRAALLDDFPEAPPEDRPRDLRMH